MDRMIIPHDPWRITVVALVFVIGLALAAVLLGVLGKAF
jgi:hypothetical protein